MLVHSTGLIVNMVRAMDWDVGFSENCEELTVRRVSSQLNNANLNLLLSFLGTVKQRCGNELFQATDSESLARARLPVSEQRAHTALQYPRQQRLDYILVNCFSCPISAKHLVDMKAI